MCEEVVLSFTNASRGVYALYSCAASIKFSRGEGRGGKDWGEVGHGGGLYRYVIIVHTNIWHYVTCARETLCDLY